MLESYGMILAFFQGGEKLHRLAFHLALSWADDD
jgi:hypothetical protein